MKIIDPGHVFDLAVLDGTEPVRLTFVKREGSKYPGNVGTHPGTTTQEVLRALIERAKYVDHQIPHRANQIVLDHLRAALVALEERAAERRGERLVMRGLRNRLWPEQAPACPTCGHIQCSQHSQESA